MRRATRASASSSGTPIRSSLTARASSRRVGSAASSTATASAPVNDCPARIADPMTCRLSASWDSNSRRAALARAATTARATSGAGSSIAASATFPSATATPAATTVPATTRPARLSGERAMPATLTSSA